MCCAFCLLLRSVARRCLTLRPHAACQALPPSAIPWNLPKFTSVESVMLSNRTFCQMCDFLSLVAESHRPVSLASGPSVLCSAPLPCQPLLPLLLCLCRNVRAGVMQYAGFQLASFTKQPVSKLPSCLCVARRLSSFNRWIMLLCLDTAPSVYLKEPF